MSNMTVTRTVQLLATCPIGHHPLLACDRSQRAELSAHLGRGVFVESLLRQDHYVFIEDDTRSPTLASRASTYRFISSRSISKKLLSPPLTCPLSVTSISLAEHDSHLVLLEGVNRYVVSRQCSLRDKSQQPSHNMTVGGNDHLLVASFGLISQHRRQISLRLGVKRSPAPRSVPSPPERF